ncbi:MAG: hypothetical protein G01um10148_728 [Parcubacteria group bacterium Gr01-1014_8]|nr:MAG: hypothetical protein G01um10148_728 [Parcubacteria group bacterium Gr01-1014_8]
MPYTAGVELFSRHRTKFLYGAAGISAFLIAASIVYPPLWLLVFAAPAPFFAALLSREIVSSRIHAITAGSVFGIVFNGVINASGWAVYPLDWIGVDAPLLSAAMIGIAWILLSCLMGITSAFFALLIFEIRNRHHSDIFLISSIGIIWLIAESFRVFLFSIFMLGAESGLDIGFSLGSVGYAFGNASSEFWIALARWGGVALLSLFPILLAASLSFAIAACIRKKNGVRRYLLLSGAILFVFLGSSAAASFAAERARGSTSAWKDTPKLTIVMAQTNFPAQLTLSTEENAERTDVVFDIAETLKRLAIKPDALILPEGIGSRIDLSNYAAISELLPDKTLLVHGKYEHRIGKPSVVQVRSHVIGGGTEVTDKQFIIPYGEYPPYHLQLPLKYLNYRLYAALKKNREYVGGNNVALGSAAKIPVGVRMCSEIFSSRLYKDLTATHGAGILVHSSSIAMFHDSNFIQREMRSAARIRAVENRVPLVQAMNGARGTAFDCRGKELIPEFSSALFNVYSISREASCVGENVNERARPAQSRLSWNKKMKAAALHAWYSLFPEQAAKKLGGLNMMQISIRETELEYWMRIFGYKNIFDEIEKDGLDPLQRPADARVVVGQCHTQAHYAGRMAVKLFNLSALTENIIDIRCGFGFYHGIIEASLGNLGSDRNVKSFSEKCQAYGDNPLRRASCLHALGHGLMVFYNYDLPTVLEKCSSLPSSDLGKKLCYHGAFMENIFSDLGFGVSEHESEWIGGSDPDFPCVAKSLDSLPAAVREQCYANQSLVWGLKRGGFDFNNAQTGCVRAPREVRDMCFIAIGYNAALPIAHADERKVIEGCATMPGSSYEKKCLVGALLIRSTLWPSEAGLKNPLFCSALGYNDLALCENFVKETLDWIFETEKEPAR